MRLAGPAAALALLMGLAAGAPEPAGQAPVADLPTPLHVEPPRVVVATSEVTVPPKPPKPRLNRKRPTQAKRPVTSTAGGDLLDRLAHCESGMDPAKNTGNGYLGAFQFLPSTARALGLGSDPTVHDYATQKAAVAKIPLSAWPSQFPGCSRRLGIR
ncbi:MAG: transglycosylase family protein [Actinomycetota bacterium]